MEIRSARSLFLSVQHKGESLSTQMESGGAGGLQFMLPLALILQSLEGFQSLIRWALRGKIQLLREPRLRVAGSNDNAL